MDTFTLSNSPDIKEEFTKEEENFEVNTLETKYAD